MHEYVYKASRSYEVLIEKDLATAVRKFELFLKLKATEESEECK